MATNLTLICDPEVGQRATAARQLALAITKAAAEFGPSPSANQLDVLQRLFAVQDYLKEVRP